MRSSQRLRSFADLGCRSFRQERAARAMMSRGRPETARSHVVGLGCPHGRARGDSAGIGLRGCFPCCSSGRGPSGSKPARRASAAATMSVPNRTRTPAGPLVKPASPRTGVDPAEAVCRVRTAMRPWHRPTTVPADRRSQSGSSARRTRHAAAGTVRTVRERGRTGCGGKAAASRWDRTSVGKHGSAWGFATTAIRRANPPAV